MTITEKLIEFFEENESIFNACIEEIDSYNGYLGDDRYYEMELLNEFYNGTDPLDILYRAFYGYDADNWYTDAHGNKEHAAFNPNRNYFKFNGYGNLVSTNYPDYSVYLDDYCIKSMLDNRNEIYTIEECDELSTLFDELATEEDNSNV